MKSRHRKRIIALIIAMLMTIGILPAAAFAETDTARKDVRVGWFTMENFMEGEESNSVRSGFTYELLCELANYSRWNIEYVSGLCPE